MLNLKVSKQTRSEASKNKVINKRVSNISITKMLRNSKLKGKYSVNEKTHLAID